MNLPYQQYGHFLMTYLRPQWRRVVLLGLLLSTTIGMQLITPQIVRRFIDTAAAGAAAVTLTRMGLLYLAVTLT
ncbi:MAG: hypothetical protein KDD78_18325, partial [Caldilineaceae bacterium]|nr:hypothetical protein [Caldilineaceae bacterium]